MKNIARLHYITQDLPNITHQKQAELACRGGATWVQLRIKNNPADEVLAIAYEVKQICYAYKAVLIINDYVSTAKQVGAHGVHLGKTDMNPNEAREVLGPHAIIGGTANSLEDASSLLNQPIDYIGLGPFRFTTTKEKLSPVLGVEGIKQIIESLNKPMPIIAIGGIQLNDIDLLFSTGIYGIAISSAINLADDPIASTQQFIAKLAK